MKPGIYLIFTILFIPMIAKGQKPVDPVSRQKSYTFHSIKDKNKIVRYLLYLPDEYINRSLHNPPLVIFLHGAGERGNNPEMIKKNGPPKLIEEGHTFPFILLSPQCPPGEWWDRELLYELIQKIILQFICDIRRVYLTGLSMGGFGTWNLACEHPGLFAALVPVCGGGNPDMACSIKDIPTWVFHGARDEIVPLQRSEEMVDALKKCGGNVQFTVYPEAGHDSWTITYQNQGLYEWMLKQSK